MYIAVLLTRAKRETTQKSIKRRMHKENMNTHAKERYSALKKEKTLARVTTKMNPWDITLYESQSQKGKYCAALLIYNTK